MPDSDSSIETGSVSHKKITRRVFLSSFARLTAAGLALKSDVVTRPEATKPDNGILTIETPEARYFPIYEMHQQPASEEELKLLPPQDIFLYEYPHDSRYFVDPLTSPHIILDTKLGSQRTYVIPRDHLEWLRDNNTKICFEGYDLPRGEVLTSVFIMAGELIISTSAGFQLLLHAKSKENSGKGMNRRQFLKLAAGLAATWGLSSVAGVIIPFSQKTEVKPSALERTVIKAHGLLSQTHPENSIIFFRNIMLARKLQFLGEVMSKENGHKAQIVYNVGKAHAGIEDFLHIGKDWTLAFLNTISGLIIRNGW